MNPNTFQRLRQQMIDRLEQKAAQSGLTVRAHIERTLEEIHNGLWDERMRQPTLRYSGQQVPALDDLRHGHVNAPPDPNVQYVETMFRVMMPLAPPSPSALIPRQTPSAEPQAAVPAARAIVPDIRRPREWGPAPMANDLKPFAAEAKAQNKRLAEICRGC